LKPGVSMLIALCLLMPCALQDHAVTASPAAVEGMVSIGGGKDPLFVAGAKVVLYGDNTMSSTQSNSEGKFTLSALRPGIYLIEADYFGLHSQRKLTIHAGEILQISLELQGSQPGQAGAER